MMRLRFLVGIGMVAEHLIPLLSLLVALTDLLVSPHAEVHILGACNSQWLFSCLSSESLSLISGSEMACEALGSTSEGLPGISPSDWTFPASSCDFENCCHCHFLTPPPHCRSLHHLNHHLLTLHHQSLYHQSLCLPHYLTHCLHWIQLQYHFLSQSPHVTLQVEFE